MRVRMMVVAVGAVLAAACTDAKTPTGLAGRGPLAEIIDGNDAGGNQSFFWLPPIVLGPSASSGANVRDLAPEVKIFECTGGDCSTLASVPVAHFTTDPATTTSTQPGNSETVRDGGNHYIVNWHTDRGTSDGVAAGGTYRICVSVGSQTLGHADVFVGNNGKEVKNARTNDDVPLVDGSTLPIKFRIEADYLTGGFDVGCGAAPPLPPPPAGATISGTVSVDVGGGPIPVENWEVTLVGTDVNGTAVNPPPTLTDASGNYSFANLLDGTYTVCEVLKPSNGQVSPTTPPPDGADCGSVWTDPRDNSTHTLFGYVVAIVNGQVVTVNGQAVTGVPAIDFVNIEFAG